MTIHYVTVPAIKCGVCGKLFPKDSKDFFSVYGNICIGLDRELVGNNIHEDKGVIDTSFFCKQCFKKVTLDYDVNTR